MRVVPILGVALVLSVGLTGCDDCPSTTESQSFEVNQRTTFGSDVKVMILRSPLLNLEEQSEDVRQSTELVINSGKLDILKVNTVYVGSRLVVSEIYYKDKDRR